MSHPDERRQEASSSRAFRHPAVGDVTVDCDSLALPDGDQHLVLYTAPPGSRGAEALAFLEVVGSAGVTS
ncbi:hypothetical protein [Amycolatopsis sp. NPDC051716]|uniref:MmyB family transcriptional regulator n=1 Tax=Amycolatopsis sp. NPDC051716 TaxID=3155804 RepID=UPI00341DC08D